MIVNNRKCALLTFSRYWSSPFKNRQQTSPVNTNVCPNFTNFNHYFSGEWSHSCLPYNIESLSEKCRFFSNSTSRSLRTELSELHKGSWASEMNRTFSHKPKLRVSKYNVLSWNKRNETYSTTASLSTTASPVVTLEIRRIRVINGAFLQHLK